MNDWPSTKARVIFRAAGAPAIDALRRERVMKSEDGSGVLLVRGGERHYVMKWARVAGWGGRIKLAARHSRFWRQRRGAAKLKLRGFDAAEPMLHAIDHTSDGAIEWLLLEHVEGPTLLEAMARVETSVRESHRLATMVGDQVFSLAQKSILNRDHKPSNLIVRTDVSGVRSLVIIDTVAIRRSWPATGSALWLVIVRMLVNLTLEPMGCDCAPRRAIWWRCLLAACRTSDRARFFHPVIVRMVVRHGDPTPRVNPLRS